MAEVGGSTEKSEKPWPAMSEDNEGRVGLWKPREERLQEGPTVSNAAKGSGWKGTEKHPEDLLTRTAVLSMTVVSVVSRGRWGSAASEERMAGKEMEMAGARTSHNVHPLNRGTS